MQRNKKILITFLFSGLFALSFFLPVLKFSFNVELNGFQAFVLNSTRLFITESYGSYLGVMGTVFAPILGIILVGWTFKDRVKLIPLILVSLGALAGSAAWMVKFSGMNLLLYGYYYWVGILLILIGYNFWKHFKSPLPAKEGLATN